jgi:hypothetical protein
VLGVVGGKLAVEDSLFALGGEVAVKLHHGYVGWNQVGTVNLDFVIALSVKRGGAAQ